MNYLAHAALAKATHESLVGNLLGDFCKGVALSSLSDPMLAALANHRAVDRFTDTHPLVQQAKKAFSPARRRFAGVALDMLFDHYLIRHWQRFHLQPFDVAKAQLYQHLAHAEPLMPLPMRLTMQKVRQQDWLNAYEHLPGLARALDNVALRIRFENAFTGIIHEITPNYLALEQLFLAFYPALQQHVMTLGLEQESEANLMLMPHL